MKFEVKRIVALYANGGGMVKGVYADGTEAKVECTEAEMDGLMCKEKEGVVVCPLRGRTMEIPRERAP